MTHQPLPKAIDFMTTRVQTVATDMSLQDVVAFLRKHEVSNAPVVTQNEAGQSMLVGFISEGDCLERLSNEVFHGNPAQPQTVGTMMKRHPVCVEPETDVFALASIFVNHRYRHLPVVEQGVLRGVVSRRDILEPIRKGV